MKLNLKQKYFKTKTGDMVVLSHKFNPHGSKETYYAGQVYEKDIYNPGQRYAESNLIELSNSVSHLWNSKGKSLMNAKRLDIVKKADKKAFKKFMSKRNLIIDGLVKRYVVNI